MGFCAGRNSGNGFYHGLFLHGQALLLGLLLLGCKPPSGIKPIQTNTGQPGSVPAANAGINNQGTATNDGCNGNVCAKADIQYLVNGSPSAFINAQAGGSQKLTFGARSQQYPGRLFAIYMIEPTPLTASMSIQGNRSASVSLSWNPTATDPTTGSIRVIARDMSACQKTNAANPALCSDFSKKLDLFDPETSLSWSLSGSSASVPNSTSNSGVLGGGLGSVIGIITGILGGGGGNVLGSIGGILGGSTGGISGQTGNFCSSQNCSACTAQECSATPGCRLVGTICSL